MFDNCNLCMFYDKKRDDLYREDDDFIFIDDPNPDKHFCNMWRKENQTVIPKDVWEHHTKCPYYIKDTPDE